MNVGDWSSDVCSSDLAEEMHLEAPEIVRKGGAYGVKLRASAPSIQDRKSVV